MKSMTGFGKGIYDAGGRKFSVELKAVNHRFLDLNIKMPKQFNYCDTEVRKTIKGNVVRGHIDVYISYEDSREEKKDLQIDIDMASKYVEAAKKIREQLLVVDDLTVSELMRFPDVITSKEEDEDEELILRILKLATETACLNLNNMRSAEGVSLKEDLSDKVFGLGEMLAEAEKRAPRVADEFRGKIKARIAELLDNVETDEARLLNEVAFFADRCAIDEEITRLKSHIKQFSEILERDKPCGKELDFVVQEMNREVNTMGSKSNDAELSEIVIGMKAEVEKMREQIQNIE